MKTAKIYDISGKEIGKEKLEPKVFEIKPNEVLLKQAVLRYLASLREPIAKTKTRAERRGGGRKPWRQKGTGRARAGSRRSPLFRKGGVIFGPTGKEKFTKELPKKVLRRAILMALSKKAGEDRIVILDNVKLGKPQTKKIKEILSKLLAKRKILFVFEKDPILFKSIANIPFVLPVLYNQLNVYDILVSDFVVISKDAFSKISSFYSILKKEPKKEKAEGEEKEVKRESKSKLKVNQEKSNKPAKRVEKAGKK